MDKYEFFRVDYVESGLPRWLIEVAFACGMLSAVFNYSPVMVWLEANAPWLQATVQTVGPVIMYYGLLRGMKPLYRPLTAWWWMIIVVNVAGFPSMLFPEAFKEVGLAVAVSLLLVYLPLGCAIMFSYRGRLQQVGIWMMLYILIMMIVPVLYYLIYTTDSWIGTLMLEVPTVGVGAIYAWMLRRVLVRQRQP